MKGIVISTNGTCQTKDFTDPLYISVGNAVGGWIEIVRPKKLHDPYVMVVNEEGLLLNLQMNPVGSYLYGTNEHGCPIVGDVVIMKEGFTEDGPDLMGLSDEEIQAFLDRKAFD